MPREVVLELRELDLELALGAARVLGKDVEDQLRPVDDAGVHGVLEVALLRRSQLVVHEKRLRARLAVRVLAAPRAFPCPRTCAGPARARCWTIVPTGSTPAARASSPSSAISAASSERGARTARRKPRSGSAPGAAWFCLFIRRLCPLKRSPGESRFDARNGLLKPFVRDRQRDADEPLAAWPVSGSRGDDDRGAFEHKLRKGPGRESPGNPRPEVRRGERRGERGGRSRAQSPATRSRRRSSTAGACRAGKPRASVSAAAAAACSASNMPSRCSSSAGGTARRSPSCPP